MGSIQEPLRCGIVGAGIAGLAAAIALTRAGLDVEIFERSQFKNEVGAAITIQPNTMYILRRWGLDFAAARQTVPSGVRALDAATGKLKGYTDLTDSQKLFGDGFISLHRVDMHSQLKDMAIAHGARLRLGSGVADFDTETGSITLRDGTTVKEDLVVVASGIHGAGMAIEDAAALEAIFTHHRPDSKSVETNLGLFNKLRHPRTSVVQVASHDMMFKPHEVVSAECAKFLPSGPFHPPAEHFSLPSRHYLFNYDIYEEAAKLSKYDKEEDVPEGIIRYFNDPTSTDTQLETK